MKFCCRNWILPLGLIALAGCATSEGGRTAFLPDSGLSGAPNRVTAKDKSLWEYRAGLDALRRGDRTVARENFDDAILTLGGIIGDKEGKKARGYFSGEERKTFIGEPYERVMAYYYRGLLYWMDGEPDNARACFRSAQLQDSDTENKEYSSDYAILDYLDGLATLKLGGDGSDAFKRAQEECKFGKPSVVSASSNVLLFMEWGDGVKKYATGQYNEELRFAAGGGRAHGATVKAAGQNVSILPYDDLYYQATTRGGRVMDRILANKAVFKSATDTIGNAALITGGALAVTQQGRHNSGDEVGLGLLAFGLVNKLVSAATTPRADIRSWENLPQYISFAGLELPPGENTITIEFNDSYGRPINTLTKTVTVTVPASGDKAVFVSDHSPSAQRL